MIIKSVDINNFLILKEAKIDLHNRGLTRICGENLDDPTSSSNGSGKSTIIEAVYWALFGDTLRHIRAADGVVNNNVGKNCSVILHVEDEGNEYRIERYRKHSSKKNNLYVYINDVDSRGKDNRETQVFIESIIGMDKQSFANSVVFGQGHSKNLRRFSEMTDSEKKETIEKVLELDVLSEAHTIAKDEHKSLVRERDLLSDEHERISLESQGMDDEIESSKQERDSFEESVADDLERCRLRKEDLLSKAEKLKDSIIESKVADTEKLKSLIEQCESIKEGQKSVIYEEKEKYLKRIAELSATNKSVEIKIKELKESMSKILSGEFDGKVCEYCGGQVSKHKISMLEGEYEFEINDRQETIKGLSRYVESAKDQYSEKERESNLVIDKASSMILEYKESISESEKNELKNAQVLQRISMTKEMIQEIDNKIEDIKEMKNPWDSVYEKWVSKKNELEKSVSDKKERISELSRYIEKYSFWVKGYSKQGIRSYLLDKVIPFLNERVNYYLNILTDGTITANFSAVKEISSGELRENFNLEVSNLNAADVYEGNSGGERRRIDLAVSLAFNDFVSSRNNKRINILLLDEVFEGVDETGLYYVIKVLEDLSRRKSSVFVITHRNELASYFSNTITVSRSNGMSNVIDSTI